MKRKGLFLGLNMYQVIILIVVFVIIIGLVVFFFIQGGGGFVGGGANWVSETIEKGFGRIFG